jgi:hypothetical protein
MKNKFTSGLASVILSLLAIGLVAQNNPQYQQRRTDYIASCLASANGGKIVLQASQGVPVDAVALNAKLNSISTGETSDFDIIELVRILFLSNGLYDTQILPVLNSVPYWINKGDTVRNYWSENHMIMWMSSDWLLHERYGKAIDANLEARLKHYLHLKVDYGFYEFFSSVYGPYCLSGLLNLADFAQEPEIKHFATLASQKLLMNFLVLANDKGTYFPASGRNYPGKFETAYGQNHNNLIYLLTGLGSAPDGASAAGPFLASSTIPTDTIIDSYTSNLDYVMHIGHTLQEGFVLNAAMAETDKTIFQWSSGAYFHPDVVTETVQLLEDSNMWHHVDFALLLPLSAIITPQSAPELSNTLSCISKSSVISGEDVAIYKHNSITLSSIQDFWKGKVGFQQHPCVANIGTTAVYPGSGYPEPNWDDRSPNNANVHLPYVKQKHNLALLMYRPESTPDIIGPYFTHKEVALHFKDADFDEVQYDSLWILGRQQNSYVAVRRACDGIINSVRACPTANKGGQTWAMLVGDDGLYGSFANFQNIVHQSQFTESWYYDSLTHQYVYYSKIVVDTNTIEYAWGVDSSLTGIQSIAAPDRSLAVFPNPANQSLNIKMEGNAGLFSVELINTNGQVVLIQIGNRNQVEIATQHLANGLYAINCVDESGKSKVLRVLIQH